MTETNLSLDNSDSRKVIIQVMGSRDRVKRRKSNYTIVVPYACLNQTIKQIGYTGGRIVNVTIQSSCLPAPTIQNKTKVPKLALSQLSIPASAIKPETLKTDTVEPIARLVKETAKTDATSVTVSEFIQEQSPQEKNISPLQESAENIEKKDLSSREKRSKKTRLTRAKKIIRNSSKSHSTKARRRAKIYLQ